MEMNRKPLKIAVYAAIGVLWAISMAYLLRSVHDDTFASYRPETRIVAGALSEWMGLYMGTRKIGYDHEEMLPSKGGFVFRTRLFMRIMLMGHEKDITTVADSTTDSNYLLKDLNFSLKTAGMEIAARGRIEHETLFLHMIGPGGETTRQIPLKEPILDSDSIVMRIVKDGFGRSVYNFYTFDPTVQQTLPVRVRILGREEKTIMNSPVSTFKLRVAIKDMSETMWVTPQGETVEEISPLGFRAVLEPRAIALTKGWGKEPVDLIAATAIRAQGISITYPAEVRSMEAYVTGMTGSELLPSFDFQTQQGDLVTVRTPADIRSYRLPYRGAEDLHGLSVRQELKSSPLINADNRNIIDTARSILNGETDARKAAAMINRWVYVHVKDSYTVALPRSIDLLQSPKGDCKAHTILFTALARAVGIPTKMAMGVVLMGDGYFYYHAWPLVYLGGWVPVDPTLGEFPADATHIVLASGDLTNWMNILGVVGKLRIDIMRARP